MKKWLILVLLTALVAGAHFSRPGDEDFERFIHEGSERQFEGAGGRVIIRFDPAAVEDSYTFHDRYIFTTIEQEGRTTYVGAFGQWFRWSDPPAPDEAAPAPEPDQPQAPSA